MSMKRTCVLTSQVRCALAWSGWRCHVTACLATQSTPPHGWNPAEKVGRCVWPRRCHVITQCWFTSPPWAPVFLPHSVKDSRVGSNSRGSAGLSVFPAGVAGQHPRQGQRTDDHVLAAGWKRCPTRRGLLRRRKTNVLVPFHGFPFVYALRTFETSILKGFKTFFFFLNKKKPLRWNIKQDPEGAKLVSLVKFWSWILFTAFNQVFILILLGQSHTSCNVTEHKLVNIAIITKLLEQEETNVHIWSFQTHSPGPHLKLVIFNL